jgi:Na+/phosphate symporter
MEGQLLFGVLAHGVMLLHLAFVLFVVLGGFVVMYFPRLLWVHVGCVIWGFAVEAFGLTCPLTPLENAFRSMAHLEGYSGDFVIRILEFLIYPGWLTRDIQYVLAGVVVVVNCAVYGIILCRERRG